MRIAVEAAARGAKPDVVWHSGKLRAKQTAEAFWRACNPLAELSATRDLQPDDPPQWIAERFRGETRQVLIAGHFPHLPRLLVLLTSVEDDRAFPPHGAVMLESEDQGESWKEVWRLV
jgi:phosphohistidine phosphatase